MTVEMNAELEFCPDHSEYWNLMGFAGFANCPKIIWIAFKFEYWIVSSFHRNFVIVVKAEAILSYAEEWDGEAGKWLPSIFPPFGPWSGNPGPALLALLANPSWPILFLLGLLQPCATGYCLLLTRFFSSLLLFSRSEIAKVVVIWVCEKWASQLCMPALLSEELTPAVCQARRGGGEVGEQ